MNAVLTQTALVENDTHYIVLQEKLLELPDVHRVELEGTEVNIFIGRALDENINMDIGAIFDELGMSGIFEFTIHDSEEEFDSSEYERQRLEDRIKSRVHELTQNDPLGAKIESVEVRWNMMTGILRAFGIDAKSQHGMIFVSDRDTIEDYIAVTNLLQRLRAEFNIPVTLENSLPFRSHLFSPRTRFQRDPVDENSIDD